MDVHCSDVLIFKSCLMILVFKAGDGCLFYKMGACFTICAFNRFDETKYSYMTFNIFTILHIFLSLGFYKCCLSQLQIMTRFCFCALVYVSIH